MLIGIPVIDPDASLYRHGHRNRSEHCGYTIRDQFRVPHQACAEGPVLHPVARATQVEVDLVIAPVLANFRTLGQLRRVAATELQRHWMLGGVKIQQPFPIAMQDGASRHHFGVQQRVFGQQPQEISVMAIRPVHHGRYG